MTEYKNITFKNSKFEFLIVLSIILLSTSPFLSKYVILLAVFNVIYFLIFISKRKKLDPEIKNILLFITILNFANLLIFQYPAYRTYIGNYVRFFLPYLVIVLVGRKFPYIYIKLIKFFTIVSFIFYIPANLIPNFNETLRIIPEVLGTDKLEHNHFIIYTIEFAKPWKANVPIYRNSGPTQEPGEFVGYLIMAMIFELIINKKLWTKNNKLFAIAILTTFSTAGYIAFFILLSAYYILFSKIKGRFILFPLSVLLAYNTYFNFEFLYGKVDQQLSMIYYANSIEDIPRDGRLPNLVRNLWDSFDQPIFGKGRNFRTRYGNWQNMREDAFANNTTAFPVQFGWPFFFYYTFLLFTSFKSFILYYKGNKNYAYVIVLIIYTLATSQGFLLFPVFITFIYLRILFKEQLLYEKKYNSYFPK